MKKSHPVRRLLRRLARGLGWLVLGLLALVLVTLGLILATLNTDRGQRELRALVNEQLLQRLGLDLTYRRVGLGLLPPRLILHDAELAGGDGSQFLSIEALSVTLDGEALLRRRAIVVVGAVIEAPRVRLVMGPGGEITNLPRLLPSEPSADGGGSSLEVALRGVRLIGGEVELEAPELLPTGALQVELGELDLRLDGPSLSDLTVGLYGSEGALRLGEARYPLRELRVEGRLAESEVTLSAVALRLGDLSLQVEGGRLGLTSPFDARAEVTLGVDLSMLATLPWSLPPAAGQVELRVEVDRVGGELDLRGRLTGGGLALSLAGADAPAELVPLARELEATLRLRDLLLTVSALRLGLAAGGEARLTGVTLDLSDLTLPIEGALALTDVDLGPTMSALGLPDPGVDLVARGELTLSGGLNPLGLEVALSSLEARDLVVGALGEQPALSRARLEGALTVGAEVTLVDRLSLSVGDALRLTPALIISGRFPHGTSAPLSSTVRSAPGGLALAQLSGLAGRPLAGQVELQASLSGPYTDPRAEAQVAARALTVEGRSIDRVETSVSYQGGVITAPSLEVQTGQSQVRLRDIRVELSTPRGLTAQAVAELTRVELADAVRLADQGPRLDPLRGTLSGQATVRFQRDLRGLAVDLEADVDALRWGEGEIGDLALAVSYDGGDVSIRRVLLSQRVGGLLSVSGQIGAAGDLDLDLDVRRLRVPQLPGLLPPSLPLTLTVDAQARVSGSIDSPSGRGELALTEVNLAGHDLGQTSLRVAVNEAGLTAEGSIAEGRVLIQELALGLAEPYPLHLRGAIRVADVARLVPEGSMPDGVSGGLNARLAVDGPLADLNQLEALLTMDELRGEVAGMFLRNAAPLQVRLGGGSARLADATLTLGADQAALARGTGGASVHLIGLNLGLAEPWPLRGRVVARLEDIHQLLGPERAPEDLSVRAEATAGVVMDLSNLDGLRGRLAIRQLEVRQSDLRIDLGAPLVVDLRGLGGRIAPAQLLFSSAALDQPRALTLSGRGSPEALSLALEGILDLRGLAPLIPQVRSLAGTAAISLRVAGSPASPALDGQIELNGLRVEVPGLPGAITDGSGRIRLSPEEIRLETLQAGVLGGRAVVDGQVGLEGFGVTGYHLDVALSDATYPLGPHSSVVLGADLNLDGPEAGETLPQLSGDVTIDRMRYEEPMRLSLDVGSVAGSLFTSRTTARTFDPGAAAIRLNIGIIDQGNIRLDNNVIVGTVHLDQGTNRIRVVGTDQVMGVLGTARVERESTIQFRGTEFEVSRGMLHFNSRSQIEAAIDFEAVAQRRDWAVTLRVTGTTDAPEISLSSEPALNEVDIVLLLTIGLTRAEAQHINASAVLAEVLSQGLDQELERALPFVDEVRLQTDYSARYNQAVPQVHIGRRLTERLRLGATATLMGGQDFDASLEYQLPEGVNLEAVYSRDPSSSFGDIGGDITIRREF